MVKKERNKEKKESIHIEQLMTGFVTFGDAVIDKKRKEKGYVTHLCTMDENSRFVDIALKEEHLKQIRDGADEILKIVERKKKEE